MKRRRNGGSGKKKEPKWKIEAKEIETITSQYSQISTEKLDKFSDLPLSRRTQEGLRKNGYTTPTDIQRTAIPVALAGKDILGAAKTGSGKTLAFLIPILELLWREKWSCVDGLGALVISPTRELAYQTFEVLRKIGTHHDFSAGLVIGGKDLSFEQTRLTSTNIIVATPGRLLQHMDETPNFECLSLKILVLDEADRILDLGFRQTMESIVSNLPNERQTLLFSATQTKSIDDLALLSLADPEYVSVDQESSTPQKLVQNYIICNLQDKISTLYSFIKNHLQTKSIVFLSSCKQVRYTYEAYRRLRPGVPIMLLHGRQHQLKRMSIYEDFCRKTSAVLLCTDIAARGLDFPSVNWVVQLDCPEDINTYIHRVGRTARYEKDGHALLFVLPSEIEIITLLKEKDIPIEEIVIDPKRLLTIQGKLDAFCAQDTNFKQLAQKSFIRYLRSVYLQSNKKVFDVTKLPTSEYALSLGLSQAPRIRFLKKVTNQTKNWTEGEKGEEERDSGDESSKLTLFNDSLVDSDSLTLKKKFPTVSFDDDILTVKSTIRYNNNDHLPSLIVDKEETKKEDKEKSKETSSTKTKKKSLAKIARSLLHKNVKVNTHVKFDEENDDSIILIKEEVEQEVEEEGGLNIEEAKSAMKEQDKLDREKERKRIREAHLKRKLMKKEKKKRKQEEKMTTVSLLGSSQGDSESGESVSGGDSEGDSVSGGDSESGESVSGGDSEGDSESGEGESENEMVSKTKRRKIDEYESESEQEELRDDEDLVLHLLNKNK